MSAIKIVMKKSIYLLVVLFIVAVSFLRCAAPERLYNYIPCECPAFNNYDYSYRIGYFTLRKVYSFEGMYVLYAQKGDSLYKIYSFKESEVPTGGCEFHIDSTYYLYLQPVYDDRSPGSNRLHVSYGFFRYDLSAKNTNRKYCVFNAYIACNIIDKYVYSKCFEIEYADIKDMRMNRIIKRRGGWVREPDIELPAEWDYLPNYK